jgi:di/tricarboxylate transporter
MGQQVFVLAVIVLALGLFVWGRVRFDFVGLGAMVVLLIGGVLDADSVVRGFANDAVLSVIAVMVAGRGLRAAGTTEPFAALMLRARGTVGPVAALTGSVGFFSTFMNNTGALAVFLPVAVHMAREMRRLASSLLMPIAFASLLGGLVTLIGTPPNILISQFRRQHLGESFQFFDFTPVGLGVAVVGIAFLAIVGWRLLPPRRGSISVDRMLQVRSYFSEVFVPAESDFSGRPLEALRELALDVNVVGVVRESRRSMAPMATEKMQAGDILLVEADGEQLQVFLDRTGFALAQMRHEIAAEEMGSDDVELQEVVIGRGSPLVGRTAKGLRMRWRFGVNLLAISRKGERILRRLPDVRLLAGDVLLIQVRADRRRDVLQEFRVFTLVDHEHPLPSLPALLLTVGIFGVAILFVAMQIAPLGLTFMAAAVLLVVTRVVSARQAYGAVDWPVILLLGSTICVGTALETSGAARLVANGLTSVATGWPAPAVVGAVMLVTMLISNVVNNAATAIMMAPIAFAMSRDLGASPDPFLMAVAVGASSCFLTPIAHQCNVLVLGPGGYHFGDYARLGLPLSLIALAVGLPLILWVWPL